MIETHAVLSWIWNADGTADIQRLAVGDEEACRLYASTAKPVTDNPAEAIIVVSNATFERHAQDPTRLRGLN